MKIQTATSASTSTSSIKRITKSINKSKTKINQLAFQFPITNLKKVDDVKPVLKPNLLKIQIPKGDTKRRITNESEKEDKPKEGVSYINQFLIKLDGIIGMSVGEIYIKYQEFLIGLPKESYFIRRIVNPLLELISLVDEDKMKVRTMNIMKTMKDKDNVNDNQLKCYENNSLTKNFKEKSTEKSIDKGLDLYNKHHIRNKSTFTKTFTYENSQSFNKKTKTDCSKRIIKLKSKAVTNVSGNSTNINKGNDDVNANVDLNNLDEICFDKKVHHTRSNSYFAKSVPKLNFFFNG